MGGQPSAVVDVEVDDGARRLLGVSLDLAVGLDEQQDVAKLERAHLVLFDVERPAVPALHVLDSRRADEQAANRWSTHALPSFPVTALLTTS